MKRIQPIVLCFGAVALSAGVTFAQVSSDFTFFTPVSLDTVDIELTQEELDRPADIYDDEEIIRVDTVTNKGAACWLRVAHVLVWSDAEGNEKNAVVGEGVSLPEGWVKGIDGWLYSANALEENENVSFEESVVNPEGSQWDGRQIEVTSKIEVQAIQRDNITPDFASDLPWGDTVPQACIYSRGGEHNGADE